MPSIDAPPVSSTTSEERNATSSWSGYIYQGKIGILLALKNISELCASDSEDIETTLEGWFLEYETYEDFQIRSSSGVESRHQIKVKKTDKAHLKGSYTDALNDFDITGCPEGKRFLHTVCEITNWEQSTVANPRNIERYQYPNGEFFCDLAGDAIQQFAIDYLRIIRPGELEGVLIQIYFYLNALLLDEVNNSHEAKPVLSLKQLYLKIKDSPIDDLQNEIHAIRLKCLLVKYLYELKDDLEAGGEDLGVSWTDAEAYISELCKLDWPTLQKFVMDIHPHNAKLIDDQDYNWIGYKEVFLELLRQTTKNFDQSARGYRHNKQAYIASTINDDERTKINLARRIMKNPNNTKVMFEGKNIVTKNMHYDFSELRGDPYDDTILDPNNIRFVKIDETIDTLNEEQ